VTEIAGFFLINTICKKLAGSRSRQEIGFNGQCRVGELSSKGSFFLSRSGSGFLITNWIRRGCGMHAVTRANFSQRRKREEISRNQGATSFLP
jgi:hypothetical protein